MVTMGALYEELQMDTFLRNRRLEVAARPERLVGRSPLGLRGVLYGQGVILDRVFRARVLDEVLGKFGPGNLLKPK